MARRRKGRLIRSVLLLLFGGGLIAVAVALAAMPRDADRNEQRAQALWSAGDIEGSLAAWDQALEQTPADGESGRTRRFELLTRRGECNLIAQRPRSALKDFRDAQQLKPGEPIAWERIGNALLALEEFTEAARHFDEGALTFHDRERYFRFAAGCANYSASQVLLEKGQALLEQRMQPGRHEELVAALERLTSTAERPPTRQEIEEGLLLPPHGTSERDKAFAILLDARSQFVEADRKLADYEESPELDLSFGRVRLEMHLRAGRHYELRRTGEILLKLPSKPEQAGELQRIRTSLAHGFHELGLFADAARMLTLLRKGYGEAHATEAARRAALMEIEERLRGRQGKEAMALLPVLGTIVPTSLLMNFHAGYAHFLANDRERALAPLERAAKILIDQDGRSGQFRDAEHAEFVETSLIDALAGCGRPELAAHIATFALRDARDRAPLLRRRIDLLRPLRDHLDEVVADEFALLKLGRDHGRNLARWEEDWARLEGRPGQLGKRVADQAARVMREYAATMVVDKSFAELEKLASAGRRSFRPQTAALESVGSKLLRELAGEPCLALHVYRALLAGGNRAQAHLLLFGLVQSQPEVADFGLLLAAHDLADGWLDAATHELDVLVERQPRDLDIALLAYDCARRRGDRDAVVRIEERLLGDDPTGLGRELAALVALDDGHPEITLRMTQGAELTTAEGRGLRGLAARAEYALGRVADAEQTATAVLAIDPAERSALTALLTILAQRVDEQGAPACDAVIAEHAEALGALDATELTRIARAVFDAGGFSGAEKLLALALEHAKNDVDAGLLRADALFALGRYDEVEKLLAPEPGSPVALEMTRRLILVRLARDGAEAAWQLVRERVAIGDSEKELARWIALIGCAAGRLQPAIDVLLRREVVLDPNSQRFVALALLAFHYVALPDAALPPGIADLMRLPSGKSEQRDRELERWLSLELASPQHRFIESLVRLLLLDDIASFRPLLALEERRLLERFPSLGFLARAQSAEFEAAGDFAQAATVLARQIEHDPDDGESLRRVALYANELDPATLERIVALAEQTKLSTPHRQLLAAASAIARGRLEEGLALLRSAAADPSTRAAALLALARAMTHQRLPISVDLGRAPWCEAASSAQVASARVDVNQALVEGAQGAGNDPALLRSVARRLHDDGARMDPTVRRLVTAALIAQPGPWFEAHEAAIAEATQLGADAATLELLSHALEAAVASCTAATPEGAAPLPLSGVRALIELGALARRLHATETAQRLADLATRSCPHDPELLALRGKLALDAGDLPSVRRHFERAVAFGSEDPELYVWLAEHALVARSRPVEAKQLAEKALATAKAATDSDLRARADEVIARSTYLTGANDAARAAWIAASKERGEDPRHSLPIALESFARLGPEAARNRIAPAAEIDGPARELLQRLLALCDAAIANAKSAPAAPSSAPPAAK